MKKIKTLFLLIAMPLMLLANDITPDSIRIEYFNHWHPFGKEGVFYYQEVFFMKKISKEVYVQEYQKVVKELKKDSTYTKTFSKKVKIPSSKVVDFIWAFSKNTIPIQVENSDKKEFLKRMTLRKAKRIAKEIEEDYFFEDNDFEERQILKEAIQSVSTLDSFIQNKMSYKYYDMVTMDYANYAKIKLFYKADILEYETKIDKLFAQPFVVITKDEKIPFYNYELNKTLIQLLPRKSILPGRLGLEYHEKSYINWFIGYFDWIKD